MCLSAQIKLEEFVKLSRANRHWKVDTNKGMGYKVFEKVVGDFVGKHGTERKYLTGFYKVGKARPVRKWLKASDFDEDPKRKTILDEDFKTYRKGWHIYLEKPRANNRRWGLYRVKFRSPIAVGDQNGELVVVADEMYIVREVR